MLKHKKKKGKPDTLYVDIPKFNTPYHKQWLELQMIYNGKCSRCNNKGQVLHHVIPRVVGGSSDIDNLTILCHDCHYKVHELIKKHCYKNTPYSDFDEIIDIDCFYKCLEML